MHRRGGNILEMCFHWLLHICDTPNLFLIGVFLTTAQLVMRVHCVHGATSAHTLQQKKCTVM